MLASIRSNRSPGLAIPSSLSMSFPVRTPAGNSDDGYTEYDEGKARQVGECSSVWRNLLLRDWWRSVSQKKIEALDHEAESHDRNAGAHPGEKGTLVGGMIAVTL